MQSMALIGKSLPSPSFTLVSLLPSVTNDTVNKAKLCCRTETVRSTLSRQTRFVLRAASALALHLVAMN